MRKDGMQTRLAQRCGVWTLALCGILFRTVWGGGFQVPTHSARAGGRGDAFTAQADDPSAIYYNPAGLTQVQGTQASTGLYAIFPRFGFDGPAGDETSPQPAYIPHFYLSSDLGHRDGRLRLG